MVLFLLMGQTRLMYFPRPYGDADLQVANSSGVQQIQVTTSQGLQVAFYVPSKSASSPDEAPKFLWLFFGGNGSLSLDYLNLTHSWDPGFSYVFVDYPGYGLCHGSPNPARIKESITALAAKLRQEFGWDESQFQARVGVIGHSLGSAAALIAAEQLQLGKAVLCAPFTSMTDMARHLFGWPLCYLNRHRYDNLARLARLPSQAQVHVFHGVADEVIPVEMSRRLAAAFPTLIRLHEISAGMHNDVVDLADKEIGRSLNELASGETNVRAP